MRTRPEALGPGTFGPTMPLLALDRKDSGRAIPSARPKSTDSAPRRCQYGLIVAGGRYPAPVLTRTCVTIPGARRIGPGLIALVRFPAYIAS
jgi:hypothetical protein